MVQRIQLGAAHILIVAAMSFGCGGQAPEPASAADEEIIDPITAIIGEVEVDESILEEEHPKPEEYTGPTLVTVRLRVVNETNPEGTFTFIDAEGNRVLENARLGVPVQVDQGVYTVEFQTPLVFGNPVYTVEDVEVTGREQEVKAEFPAGQVTLHTYEVRPTGPCVETRFSVFSETLGEELPGKGTSCSPVILEVGNYEIKLQLTKRKYTSVGLPVNKGQVRTNSVKLTAD